ncbi:nuclear transcription factor Y subunit B-3 [Iris pallida]|uniref:Nuclear transcription factor Y subunit B-3 n=1 Tax=Iris pallida TaxID=29817 RepID=A0AAX6HUV5_IRIPA|nr:nuclear transcription factor Y subunit B-3 [Iris pallida]KAJ6804902.1 nuclear transcription factor Y subunit B-3 [Iris pallida]KAJ6844830.1 nuclear transcription factor Y subunit B-3 [Iris pallida]
MAQRRSSPLMVLRFSRWHLSEASPVMKLMNSETHSWTVSFASLEIFAFAGRAFFMIRLTLAIGRNRSCSRGDEYSPEFPPPRALFPPDSLSESAILGRKGGIFCWKIRVRDLEEFGEFWGESEKRESRTVGGESGGAS